MFVNINKIINPLAGMVKKKKIQINNIKSKNWDITIYTMKLKMNVQRDSRDSEMGRGIE